MNQIASKTAKNKRNQIQFLFIDIERLLLIVRGMGIDFSYLAYSF